MNEHLSKAIQFADKVKQSEISEFVTDVILYGSVSRGVQKYDSDIDILIVVRDSMLQDINISKLLREFRCESEFESMNSIQIDIHYCYLDDLMKSDSTYFWAIRRDGVSLWQRKHIMTMQTIKQAT